MTDKSALPQRQCKPCSGKTPPMTAEKTKTYLEELEAWELASEGKAISRRFLFKNFHQTMAFINAMADIANTQDHHPDFSAGYNYCQVTYTTHAIGGLSENDFICAAQINRLRTAADCL